MSTGYKVVDSDEGSIQLEQVAVTEDERGQMATKQTLSLATNERPGETINVTSAKISNIYTEAWTTTKDKKVVPDFTKASPEVKISCSFN